MNRDPSLSFLFPSKDEIYEHFPSKEQRNRACSHSIVNDSSDSDDFPERFDSIFPIIPKTEEILALENELYNLMMEETLKTQKGLPGRYFKQIKKMKVGVARNQCSVCVCNLSTGEIIRKLPCGHIFHEDCLKPWLRKHTNCPLCRMDLLEYFTKRC